MDRLTEFASLVDAGIVEWDGDIPKVVARFDPFDATADEMAANTKFQARHIVETAPMSHRDLARLMAEKPRVRA